MVSPKNRQAFAFALAAAASCTAFAAQAAPFPAPTVTVNLAVPATGAVHGWQKPQKLTISQGAGFEHLSLTCPENYPIAQSGAYAFNGNGEKDDIAVTFNGPLITATKPNYATWQFYFNWPNGANANETVTIDVMCEQSQGS